MSILIDKLKNYENNQVEINGKWYIAKPLNNLPVKNRIKDSIKVLMGKAITVHYKEKEIKRRRNK